MTDTIHTLDIESTVTARRDVQSVDNRPHADRIRETVLRNLEDEQVGIDRRNAIRDVLAKYDDRDLQVGRIEAMLQKAGLNCRVERSFDMVNISFVEEGKSSYNDRMRIFVGHERRYNGVSDFKPFTLARFDESTAAYGSAAVKRQEQRRAFLDSGEPERLGAVMDDLAMAVANYHDVLPESYDMADHYAVRDLLPFTVEKKKR